MTAGTTVGRIAIDAADRLIPPDAGLRTARFDGAGYELLGEATP